MSVTVASVLCAGLAGTARVARQPLGLCLAAPPAGGAVCIVPAVRQRRGNGARGKVRAARARASIRDQLEGMSWLSLDSGLVDHSDVQQTTEPTRQLLLFEDLAEQLLDESQVVKLPAAEAVQLVNFSNKGLDRLVRKLGKSKKLWPRVLVLHEWFLLIGHEPDTRLCTSMMMICYNHGKWLRALNLFDWMQGTKSFGGSGLQANVFTYTTAVRAATRAGLPQRAVQIWEDSLAASCRPDAHLVSAAITAYIKAGCPSRALEVFEDTLEAVEPSVQLYNQAMRAAIADGQCEQALLIWDQLAASGLELSVQGYTTAISACAPLQAPDRAAALFRAMRADGLVADCAAYTALIRAHASQGQWQRATKILDYMCRQNVWPNASTYTSLIIGMSTAGAMDEALEVYARMQRSGPRGAAVPPNSYTHSALLTGLGKARRFTAAADVFRRVALDAGIKADPFCRPGHHSQEVEEDRRGKAVGSLTEAGGYPGEGEPAGDVVSAVLEQLRGAGPPAGVEAPAGNRPLNAAVCGAMMGACARCGCWREALCLLAWLEAASPASINSKTLNSCLSALGKAGQCAAAKAVYEHYEPISRQINRETLLAAYGYAGKVRQAEAVFQDILSRGETPKAFAFAGLVMAYRMADRPRAALLIRDRMRALGAPPSVHVYNQLLLMCEQNQMWDKALDLIRSMTREQVARNKVTCDVMSTVSKQGMRSVEDQQAAAAAWSAAATVAGAVLFRIGLF